MGKFILRYFNRLILLLFRTPLRGLTRRGIDFAFRGQIAERDKILPKRQLTATEEHVLRNLREKGFSYAHTLIPDQLLTDISFDLDKLIGSPANQNKLNVKYELGYQNLLIHELIAGNITEHSSFIRILFEESLLQVARHYLDQVPHIANVLVVHTFKPFRQNVMRHAWHRDQEDSRILKLFVYLSDVLSEDDGPFIMFDRVTSQKRLALVFERPLSDRWVEKRVMGLTPLPILGKKLTVFLVDSINCVHQAGNLPSGKSRLLYIGWYTPWPSTKSKKSCSLVNLTSNASMLHKSILRQ
jgi:hypothetical protein